MIQRLKNENLIVMFDDEEVTLHEAIKYTVFPGGELNVSLNLSDRDANYYDNFRIYGTVKNSNDVMTIVMVKDILNTLGASDVELCLTYMPYSRQDRVCHEGEAFSLKAFARIINSLNFKKVITFDAHSDVTAAVFDNLQNVSQEYCVGIGHHIDDAFSKVDYVVAPDAGALKKCIKNAELFECGLLRADKQRDTNGEIIETIIHNAEKMKDKSILITDDIIDGGKTVIELVKLIKTYNPKLIQVYCTHGIFSNGTQCLFDAGIDKLITTDSYCINDSTDHLKIIKLKGTIS